MDLDKKKSLAKKAYEPYFKEAGHCLKVYIIISLLVTLILLAFSLIQKVNTFPVLILAIGFYTIFDCLFNYRLIFLIMNENKKMNWEKQEVTIVKISTEASWSGHLWESIISKLYPKNQQVDRYKLVCIDRSGKKIVLRSVMSGKKYQIVSNRIFYSRPTTCRIAYGKHSKIIMYYEGQEEWTAKMNQIF